jgi:hypothetical protein
MRTDLGAPATSAILSAVHGSLPTATEQCLRQALQAVRDVAFGAGPVGFLVIAGFEESSFPAAKCLAAVGAKASTKKDLGEAFELDDTLAVHQPGLLLFGNRQAVTKALEPRSGNNFPSAVALLTPEFAVWSLAAKGEVSVSGSLEQSSDRFRLQLEGDVPASLSDEMEQGLQSGKGQLGRLSLSATEAAQVKKLVDAVDFRHDGGHIVGSMDLHEPVADQARDLGAMAALTRSAVHEYQLNSMKAEAKNSLGAIARDFMALHERETMDGVMIGPGQTAKTRRPRLMTLPPVPRTIPRGTPYQSRQAEWKAWEPIKFMLDGPQRFQYEVRASSDGLSADAIARGDLEGNGKITEFRLHLRIEPDPNNPGDKAAGPVVEDEIVER